MSLKLSKRLSAFETDKIPENNLLLKIFCCLTITVLICIAIGHYAFKNGALTCDHYVFNTYLYIILAVVLIFLVILINDKFGIFNQLLNVMFSDSRITSFISLLILIAIFAGLTYALQTINPSNILASNGIWLLLVLLIGIMMIPLVMFGRLTDVLGLAGILTLVIVIVVGLLGYYMGDKIITFDWDKYLMYALIALIVISFAGGMFITDINTLIMFMYFISIAGLIIFILLLLSNHKKLKENSEKCIDGKTLPNYPLESWSLVIKIVNIFSDLVRILGIRKLLRRR